MKTDLQIQKEVMDELKWERLLNSAKIDVNVFNGTVSLRGCVNAYSKKFAAGQAAARVHGIRRIADDVEVVLSADNQFADCVLEDGITNILKWSSVIPDNRITVSVYEARVYLEGEVEWKYQREAVLNCVRCLRGIKNITDHITVNARPDLNPAREDVCLGLEMMYALNAARISVAGGEPGR